MRGKIKIIGSLLLICLFILCFSTVSNAAIEIKAGTKRHTNINISTAYQYCYDMRSATSTLGINSLDSHLSLNADWGATAYLGASTYGGVRNNNGTMIKINEANNLSTTNNITGVMNLGSYLAGNMLYDSNSFVSCISDKRTGSGKEFDNIYKNKDTKYVEIIPTDESIEKTRGMALIETNNWYGSGGTAGINENYPIMYRRHIFGKNKHNGSAGSGVTYRPVIWN